MMRAFVLVLAVVPAALAAPRATAQDASGFLLPQAERIVFRDCADCPEMVVLESGLALSSTPVTRAQFGAFAEATGFGQGSWGCVWRTPEIPQEQDHPVVCVSWNDAVAYADWLSTHTGRSYRLPTAEEFAYASAGGEIGNYWWGQDVGEARANCLGCGSPWDGKGTAPVGSFAANRFGVKDAVGNVWVWLDSCAPDGCDERLLAGGSWFSPAGDLRAGRTIWNAPDRRFDTYGLRVVTDAAN